MPSPDEQIEEPQPAYLRRLSLLVTVLTATMIIGLIIIVSMIVITFTNSRQTPELALPATLDLPEGHHAEAITAGDGWVGAVTTAPDGTQSFHILNPETGALRQSIEITK